ANRPRIHAAIVEAGRVDYPLTVERDGHTTTGRRAALVISANAIALVFAGSALASYTPRIVIDHTPPAIGSAGTTDLTVSFDRNDDATAKATIYGAPEYTGVTLDQAPGTQVGTVDATVIAKQISPTPLPLRGTIKADDPLKYVSNPSAPGIHAVVL